MKHIGRKITVLVALAIVLTLPVSTLAKEGTPQTASPAVGRGPRSGPDPRGSPPERLCKCLAYRGLRVRNIRHA